MKLNLNQFLLALSDALDFVEIDILGATKHHSKRVAYISLRLADLYLLDDKEKFDLCSFAILHDNGLSEEVLLDALQNKIKSDRNILEKYTVHCQIGEDNIKNFPFQTARRNIVKYHHESHDGSGIFGLKEDEIPILAQIISLADTVDNLFHFDSPTIQNRDRVIKFINKNSGILYSPLLVENFNILAKNTSFWLDLQSVNLENLILKRIPSFVIDICIDDLVDISEVFRKIIDSNSEFTGNHSSGLSEKMEIMSEYYNYDYKKTKKLMIAANLHDLGKLSISNKILNKKSALNNREFAIIKSHPYYTRQALEKVVGLDCDDIANWASNHHEKLDGSGYPYGLSENDLDFESRLMCCLDIYQALAETRPYRVSLSHEETILILKEQVNSGFLDGKIVDDLDRVFGSSSSQVGN
jgi:HD-GYP domain-containing protein (c-di-GMP phosphodiesterase class II)